MSERSSLSVTYFDPESEPVPEPVAAPAPEEPPKPGEPTMNLLESEAKPKKRGRPPGSKNKRKRKKRKIPWFKVWRATFWGVVSVVVISSVYLGVQGWLGQSAAYLALAASTLIAGFALDYDWKSMREK